MKALGGPRGAGRRERDEGAGSGSGGAEALAALADERFDVLIVGGGIVGRRGAARRHEPGPARRPRRAAGHRVRHVRPVSSRLIHGGLRYLEQLHFGLVYEALSGAGAAAPPGAAPRHAWSRSCSRSTASRSSTRAFYGSGIFLYDLLGRAAGRRVLEAPPAVERDRVRAGPPAQGPDRRDHLSRRGRGRRPTGARGAADGARRRGGRGDAGPRDGAAARRRAAHRRDRRGSRERESSSTSAPSA